MAPFEHKWKIITLMVNNLSFILKRKGTISTKCHELSWIWLEIISMLPLICRSSLYQLLPWQHRSDYKSHVKAHALHGVIQTPRVRYGHQVNSENEGWIHWISLKRPPQRCTIIVKIEIDRLSLNLEISWLTYFWVSGRLGSVKRVLKFVINQCRLPKVLDWSIWSKFALEIESGKTNLDLVSTTGSVVVTHLSCSFDWMTYEMGEPEWVGVAE